MSKKTKMQRKVKSTRKANLLKKQKRLLQEAGMSPEQASQHLAARNAEKARNEKAAAEKKATKLQPQLLAKLSKLNEVGIGKSLESRPRVLKHYEMLHDDEKPVITGQQIFKKIESVEPVQIVKERKDARTQILRTV